MSQCWRLKKRQALPTTRSRKSKLASGGLPAGNENGIGGCWTVTSTYVRGCWQAYGETASDGLVNRYYSNAYGRFMTPDPYRATSASTNNPANPASWNRYSYVLNDPVNHTDPKGLCATMIAQTQRNRSRAIPPPTIMVVAAIAHRGGSRRLARNSSSAPFRSTSTWLASAWRAISFCEINAEISDVCPPPSHLANDR